MYHGNLSHPWCLDENNLSPRGKNLAVLHTRERLGSNARAIEDDLRLTRVGGLDIGELLADEVDTVVVTKKDVEVLEMLGSVDAQRSKGDTELGAGREVLLGNDFKLHSRISFVNV